MKYEDYIKEREYRKQNRIPIIIKAMEEMKPFTDHIPEPPVVDMETYNKHVVPNFIRCGAIPKEELIIGKTYYGNCRNASEAIWNGEYFIYDRYKFGVVFPEKIRHFQDDTGNGEDVFVPVRIIEK